MKVETSRFGTVDVNDDDLLDFPEGLLGFAACRRFAVLPNPSGGPLQWLQSLEDPSLAFVICQPQLFKPDYRIPVREEDLKSIDLSTIEDALVFTIMVVPKDNPKNMTANLQGPLIINRKKRVGKQYVLIHSEYTTKYRLFPQD